MFKNLFCKAFFGNINKRLETKVKKKTSSSEARVNQPETSISETLGKSLVMKKSEWLVRQRLSKD